MYSVSACRALTYAQITTVELVVHQDSGAFSSSARRQECTLLGKQSFYREAGASAETNQEVVDVATTDVSTVRR